MMKRTFLNHGTKKSIYALLAWVLLLLLSGGLFISCERILLNEDIENTPTVNYRIFCDDFRNLYGAFDAKEVDWDSLTNHYSAVISDDMGYAELYEVLTEMLHILNDGHADIRSEEHGLFRSWNRRNKPYFKGREGMDMDDVQTLRDVIKNEYLNDGFESESFSGWTFFYGTINHQQKNLGYLCIPTFYISNFPNHFIQEAIETFRALDGVIIDLRFNQGGTTEAFVGLNNRFGTEEKLYMQSRFRNGPGLNDFSPMAEHWVRPHSTSLKNMPLAILTNAYTASSSDHFVLAMKSQPDVICVGDTTCGAFSGVLERILPNGWRYRLGAQVIYDTEGKYLQDDKGNYLEGIGIAPDFYIEDDWDLISANRDTVLEKALFELTKP